MEIYSKNALHFPNLLENPESYIDFCVSESIETGIPWDPWMSGGDETPHPYGELWTIKDTSEEEKILLDGYDKAVLTAIEGFLSHIGAQTTDADLALDKIKSSRPRALAVKRYYLGEELGFHPDADPNKTSENLLLTISMYFNSGYEGGLLGFMDGSKISLTSGSVVVFPATYLHESTKVTSGVKYVSNEVVSISRSILGVDIE